MKPLLIFIALIMPGVVFAQETLSVTIRAFCFQRDPSGIDRLAVKSPDSSVIEMKFPESFFSPKTKVPVIGGKVVFHNAANQGGAPISVATIPQGVKSVFILFFPVLGEKDKMVYRTSVIDASHKRVPKDGAMVMNLYSKELRAAIGEHRVLIKPGAATGVARPKQRNDYNMSPVAFFAESVGTWQAMSETLVRFPEENRQLFLAYPDGKTGRLSFRSIQIGDY